MTNLSSITELPRQSALRPHSSYDKLGSSSHAASSPPPSAVSLTYAIPQHASAVQHAGSLHKRSSILKQWHTAYYALDGLLLTAYPSQAAHQHVVSQPPSPSAQQYKRLELHDVAVKSLSPSAHNRPYCFALLSRDSGKEHLFAAPSEQARTGWIDAITKALKAADAGRKERPKDMGKAVNDAGRDRYEKGELINSPARARREEVMSGKGLYSNALITSSSSSSLASITHNLSASTSSNSLSSTADLCHSCHSPFTLALRPVACTRCARSYCDGCAPHTVLVKGGEVDEERRVCNRCHEGLTEVAGAGGVGSGAGAGEGSLLGSRRTTRNGMLSDDMDEVDHERITINVAPSSSIATTNLLPPLPPLTTSTSSSDSAAVLLTNPAVEATRELISPAPNPSSPPPSPLSPIHHSTSLLPALPSRPASPAPSASPAAQPSPSATSPPPARPLLLSVRVPDSREKDIVVLSRDEIERVEAERRRKGLPDGGARMGSVVIGAPIQPQQPVKQAAGQVAKQQAARGGEGEMAYKKPWYACGCF